MQLLPGILEHHEMAYLVFWAFSAFFWLYKIYLQLYVYIHMCVCITYLALDIFKSTYVYVYIPLPQHTSNSAYQMGSAQSIFRPLFSAIPSQEQLLPQLP